MWYSIAKNLKYSPSAIIHRQFGNSAYVCKEVDENELEDFIKGKKYDGLNIGAPYKIRCCGLVDEISGLSRNCGAVNTVINRNGKLFGYNTDWDGVAKTFKKYGIDAKNKTVLVLGTGGTSQTVKDYCFQSGAREVITVSREGRVNYDNVYCFSQAEIVVNCTPIGKYPNDGCPLDLKKFPSLQFVFDLNYFPLRSRLLIEAKESGIKHADGLIMLVEQARKAEELFMNKKIADGETDIIYKKAYGNTVNIVLTGMSGAGKSVAGKELAGLLHKNYLDTDNLVVERVGMPLNEYILKFGQEKYRETEKSVIKDLYGRSNTVIATGEGAVLDRENAYYLQSNAIVIFIDNKNAKKYCTSPLIEEKTFDQIYKERYKTYIDGCDYFVKSDNKEKTVKLIRKMYDEIACY